MDLTQIPIFKAMAKKLAWLGARQAVLAQNIASANTPSYRASDLKPVDFGALLGDASKHVTLIATAPGHITTPPGSNQSGVTPVQSKDVVALEDQMMKVSETATDYAFTTNLYQKQISMIKTALGH